MNGGRSLDRSLRLSKVGLNFFGGRALTVKLDFPLSKKVDFSLKKKRTPREISFFTTMVVAGCVLADRALC